MDYEQSYSIVCQILANPLLIHFSMKNNRFFFSLLLSLFYSFTLFLLFIFDFRDLDMTLYYFIQKIRKIWIWDQKDRNFWEQIKLNRNRKKDPFSLFLCISRLFLEDKLVIESHDGSANYWAEPDLNQRRHIANEFTVRPH